MMSRIPEVGSVMTPCPHSIDAGAGVHEAQALLERHDIRHLPVTEGERIVGLVSDRDVRHALDPLVGAPPMREVRRIMSSDPFVVDAAEPLDSVLLTLARRRIGCALVAREGKLVGILTATDACRLYGEALRSTRQPGS